MKESSGEREKVRGSRFARQSVLHALIFDSKNDRNVNFLRKNAIKHDFLDKPNVGNLSEGLESVNESICERQKVGLSKYDVNFLLLERNVITFITSTVIRNKCSRILFFQKAFPRICYCTIFVLYSNLPNKRPPRIIDPHSPSGLKE